jgi:hypothetical protein
MLCIDTARGSQRHRIEASDETVPVGVGARGRQRLLEELLGRAPAPGDFAVGGCQG